MEIPAKKTKVEKKAVIKTEDTTSIIHIEEVRLISFTMKSTISIGAYENITTEVTVEAESLKKAHDNVMPYIDGLIKKYSINNHTFIETSKDPQQAPVMTAPIPEKPSAESIYQKAFGSISATTNHAVLDEYLKKVTDSITFSEEQKINLYDLITKQKSKSVNQ